MCRTLVRRLTSLSRSIVEADFAAGVVDVGLLCDLLWSDPDKDITGWSENDRGVSFTFGPDVVSRFLQKHDMDLICRAHQVRLLRFAFPDLSFRFLHFRACVSVATNDRHWDQYAGIYCSPIARRRRTLLLDCSLWALWGNGLSISSVNVEVIVRPRIAVVIVSSSL